MRVVQMEPGPMPTFTASAPASTSAKAASAVATLPATMSMLLNACLTSRTVSMTPLLCPWAVSTMTASTPASTRAETLSWVSAVTPTAAATRRRPYWSLQELGNSLSLMMSRYVMRPTSFPAPSTTGNFSIRCSRRICSAWDKSLPSCVTMRFSLVINSAMGRAPCFSKRRSRFVTMPTSMPASSVTGMPPILCSRMMASASPAVASLLKVTGSWIMPLSERFTLRTSLACAAMLMFLCTTPMPPFRAMAMAMRLSVTVSMAALTMGAFSWMFRENGAWSCTSRGSTSE